MIETWPGKGTLAIWAVSGVAAVAAIVSHNDQLLLKAGGLFLSATAGEFFQETIGRQIRRLRRDLLSMPGANKAASYNNRGNSHDQRGDLESAIADYTEALRFNPKYIEALINRGRCLSKRGDCEKAIADLGEAIRLNPKNSMAYFYRGCCYGKKRDFERALADFDRSLLLDPNKKATIAAKSLSEKRLATVRMFSKLSNAQRYTR